MPGNLPGTGVIHGCVDAGNRNQVVSARATNALNC